MAVVPDRFTKLFAGQKEDATTQTPVADIFLALAHERRWRTVELLAKTSEGMSLDFLVKQLAAPELAEWPECNKDALERQITIDLCHHHLPKLEEFGAIEWQPGRETITKTESTPAFAQVVEAAYARSTYGGAR